MARTLDSFYKEHERIFGKKTFRQMASDDGINRHQHRIITGNGTVHVINVIKRKIKKKKATRKRRVAKELCPHCATKNLIRVDEFTVKCKKCGYEKNHYL